jgi:peptidoglycan/xylan/chitin deacetylase (PgdA/CDA1 family)/TolA-binding protein
MRLKSVLLVLLCLACSRPAEAPAPKPPAPPPVAPAPRPAPASNVTSLVEDVVRDFRRVVLLTSGEGVDERRRFTAWMVHQRNQEHLESLEDLVVNEPGARDAFLMALEASPALHDADKLAFRDVLDALPASPRLDADRAALDRIQARYEKELAKIMAALGTRGFVERREAWEDYLSFVRKELGSEDLNKEFEAEWVAQQGGMRGPSPWRDGDDTIVGRTLPEKSVVLSFDDGPKPKRTAEVLDILRRFGAHGVFFQVGRNVAHAEAASQMVLEAGHALGNHSFSHACLPKLEAAALTEQIEKTNSELEGVLKQKPVLFRPPYGARNQAVLDAAKAHGMRTVLWNVDSQDWADPVPSSIALHVLKEVEREKRGIILFHDIHARTAEALPLVLEKLVADGYSFYVWNGSEFAPDGTRGAEPVQPVASLEPSLSPYHDSWAVIIGINDYQHWPKLSYAVNDAEGVKTLLEQGYGFQADHVTLLQNGEATRARILAALSDDLLNGGKVTREDRVFVFFAGHGATRSLPNGRTLGYLVPVDADTENLQSQAISMTALQEASDSIPAKHVFFVMDACYSGLALTRGGAGQAAHGAYLQEITRRGTREVLTAGGADQQVADNGPGGHSIFTWTLLEGLSGKADLDSDFIITATELSAYVAPSVSALSRQTPVFGHLVGSEGGEFVFMRRAEADFLSADSEVHDARATELNGELDKLKQTIESQKAQNQELERKVKELSQALEQDRAQPKAELAPEQRAQAVREELSRGMTLYREQKYAEALAAFERMLAIDPLNALAANNIGFVHTKLGHAEEALRWYEKTVAIDPARAVAWVNLGDAYVGAGRPVDARRAYERYSSLAPQGKLAADVTQKLARLPP